ncbi:MAG TPA: hypothetical protein VOA87_20285 [Thermoanaerobaculia bacterium]|nr:hypothetical protein [Thermoanaerobaculia bacterium]
MEATGAGSTASRPEPRIVSTLLGHAHVEMGLACLGSLLRYSAQPLRLRVHDDGSLTANDLERLTAELGQPRIVSRADADERMAGFLAGRPATRAFRAENPLGLKLLDVALLAEEEEIAYCDSDVLFLRPFSHLFRLRPEAGALFMCDPQNAYSLRSWHLLLEPRLRRLRLPGRVNTGILAFRKRFFDPNLVEWYLSRPSFRFAPVWAEQTAWALLGAAAGCRLLDPRRISIPLSGQARDPEQVALHFVSPVRGLLDGFLQASQSKEELPAEPVEIGSIEAPICGPANLAATEIRRRWRRLRRRRLP